MFPLAHLGIGSVMIRPFSKTLPFRWVLLGTLLPDLIDKSVYFCLGLIAHFQNGGWIPGKRGVAHTILFLLALGIVSIARRSEKWLAITLGDATHLLLDLISKLSSSHSIFGSMTVLFWPIMGWDFPTLSYGMHGVVMLVFEAIGCVLLLIQLCVKGLRPQKM